MDELTYTAKDNRKFGISVGIAFLLLAGLLFWRDRVTAASIVSGLGAALFLAGLIIPGRLGPVHRGWMRFALMISKVTTPIFMGLVYYLSVLPIGIVMRVLGKNPMTRHEHDSSYWVDRRSEGALRSDLERQF